MTEAEILVPIPDVKSRILHYKNYKTMTVNKRSLPKWIVKNTSKKEALFIASKIIEEFE